MRHLKDMWIGTLQTGQALFVALWEKVMSLEGSRKKNKHVLWHERENNDCSFKTVFSLFSLFKEIKVSLRDHHTFCVSVCSPRNFRMPKQIFMKLGMYYHGIWADLNGIRHKSLLSDCVCVCAFPCRCWQRIGKNVTAAKHSIIELLTRRFLYSPCRIKK
jgi:hypothetical protein